MYGLKKKNSSLKFIFDGDELDDNDTPNSLDLEDDDMFDAKVSHIKIFIYSSKYIYFNFLMKLLNN
jgi:hypothetical protein